MPVAEGRREGVVGGLADGSRRQLVSQVQSGRVDGASWPCSDVSGVRDVLPELF